MRKASAIQSDQVQITTIEDLTGVFESIASTHVAKVKSKVELSTEFFSLLWKRYSSLRTDPKSQLINREKAASGKPNVFVIISAASGLSGDIDNRLLEQVRKDFDPTTCDLIVLGDHGANQLKSQHIPYVHHFSIPETDSYVDVGPLIAAIQPYAKTTIYYESYESLGEQTIRKIDLVSSIKALSSDSDEEVLTPASTVFEPSLEEIADHMEETMISLAFSQMILESNLAQNASRFNAMAVAKKRSLELALGYMLEYHRAKRNDSDRRMREVMVGLKRKKRAKRAQ